LSSHGASISLSRRDATRLLAGLAIQPFIAGALAFLVFPWLLLDSNGRSLAGGTGDMVHAAGSVAIGAAVVALGITLVAALPAAVWLTTRRRVPISEALLWGLGLGNVPMVAGTLLAGTYGVEGFVRGIAFSSVLGVAGASVFWTIALRRT